MNGSVRARVDEKERESFEEVRQEEDGGREEGDQAEGSTGRVVRNMSHGDPS